MHLLRYILLGFGLYKSGISADTTKYPQSVKLTYQVLGTSGSNKPSQLAEVLYDPTTLKSHLSSWTPPSTDNLKSTSQDGTSAPLVRVSLPDGASTVTSLNSFDPSLSQYINIWISSGSDPAILSANISPISPPPLSDEEARLKRKEERLKARGKPVPSPKAQPKPKSKPKKGKTEEADKGPGGPVVQVKLERAGEGPKPQLFSRPPPQVDGEGREIPAQEQQEKTLFQKYWWVFAIGAVLVMTGGGDGK